MTNQEAFDVMVRHLRKQGCKSLSASGRCVYRGPRGLRCAVGALIPDDEYCMNLEYWGASWVQKKVPALEGISTDILEEMQMIHDSDDPMTWERYFAAAAKSFGLTLPPLESEASHA